MDNQPLADTLAHKIDCDKKLDGKDKLYWVVLPGQVPSSQTVEATVNAQSGSGTDMWMSDAIALDKANRANFLFYAKRRIRRGETLFIERARGVVPRARVMEVLINKGRAVCSPKRKASLPMVAGIIDCMKQDVLQLYASTLAPTVAGAPGVGGAAGAGVAQWDLFGLLNAKDLFPRTVESPVVRDLLTERAMFQAMFKAAGIAHGDKELPVSVLHFAKIYCNAFAYISLTDAAALRSVRAGHNADVKADGDTKEIKGMSKPARVGGDQVKAEAILQGRCVFPLGSFFNNSCEPNTKQFYKYSQAPYIWMAIEALHDIDDGEEITIHYGDDNAFVCSCAKCVSLTLAKLKRTACLTSRCS